MRQLTIDYHPDTAERLGRLVSQDGFVFLDSCHPRSRDGRFDIVSSEPSKKLITRGLSTELHTTDGVSQHDDDPFRLLEVTLKERAVEAAEDHDPLPFNGGAIGYFSYDLARRIERVPERCVRDIDIPEMVMGIYEWAAVIDHRERCAWVVAPDDSSEDLERRAEQLHYDRPLTPAAFGTSFQVMQRSKPDISYENYAEQFHKIKQYITDGDCYQVNYAQRFAAHVSGNSWDAYRRLRNLNPAPFSAYLTVPGATILSSSPERFLKVVNRRVETKPIKGTVRRGADPIEDRYLADVLKHSKKDQAENVMIVDLMRNDIGRTCEIGSVNVSRLFAVESFAKVHHLVSTVNGRLAEDTHPSQLLRGCFPGGSITGAPKLRAMEIIEELEPTRRAVYCGSIGYLGFDGAIDTNIAIRTLLHYGDRMFCWAGGGIVADSKLDGEYQECLDKAAAMLDVFEHAESQYLDR